MSMAETKAKKKLREYFIFLDIHYKTSDEFLKKHWSISQEQINSISHKVYFSLVENELLYLTEANRNGTLTLKQVEEEEQKQIPFLINARINKLIEQFPFLLNSQAGH